MVRNVVLTLLLAIAILIAIALRLWRHTPPAGPADAMTLRVYDVRDLLTDEFWGNHRSADAAASADARVTELVWLIREQSGMNNFEPQQGVPTQGASRTATVLVFSQRLCVVQSPHGQLQVEALLERLRAAGHVDAK
jgi:hypothetical protein